VSALRTGGREITSPAKIKAAETPVWSAGISPSQTMAKAVATTG
jgi:hypothetical protein